MQFDRGADRGGVSLHGCLAEGERQMASITYEFYDATTGFRATCTIEEVGDGTLLFTIDVDESTGTLGDLRGLFFDLNNDDPAFLETLDATGDDVTGELFQQDNVTNLGSGANVNGEVVNETGRFDAGVEIGSSGLKGGADDIQFTQFTLSSSEYYLTLDMVTSVDTALRATSVGDADGSRNGSLKLVGDMSSGVISGATMRRMGMILCLPFADEDALKSRKGIIADHV